MKVNFFSNSNLVSSSARWSSPGSKPVDFQTMTRCGHPVRRLSTVSSITKPSHYVLTTRWLWYYKGDHENWIEYGKPVRDNSKVKKSCIVLLRAHDRVCVCDCQDDKHRVTSVKSCDLEEMFLSDCNAEVTVIKGNRQYYISFQGNHTLKKFNKKCNYCMFVFRR